MPQSDIPLTSIVFSTCRFFVFGVWKEIFLVFSKGPVENLGVCCCFVNKLQILRVVELACGLELFSTAHETAGENSNGLYSIKAGYKMIRE